MGTKDNFQFDYTSRLIAKTLLFSFIGVLIALLVMNWYLIQRNCTEAIESWFELFKSGLILLGTSLTTITGYYFGQRDSAQSKKEAALSEQKANEYHEIADGLVALSDKLKMQASLSYDKKFGAQGDDPEDFSKLKRKPRKKG